MMIIIDRSLNYIGHSLNYIGHSLDYIDHSLDYIDHSLDYIDHSLDHIHLISLYDNGYQTVINCCMMMIVIDCHNIVA